jgi:hypothetical protein
MRRRLRKKLHRKYLTTVCAHAVTFDDHLRRQLLKSVPATPFRIENSYSPGIQRLMHGRRLSYWVTLAKKLAPDTAIVVLGRRVSLCAR